MRAASALFAAAAAAAALSRCPAAAARFELAAVFGDGMVLQRDVPARVWGWADPGATVYAALFNLETNATANVQAAADPASGLWVVALPPQPGGPTPYTLAFSTAPIIPRCILYAFSCDAVSTTLEYVLFGDVIFCSCVVVGLPRPGGRRASKARDSIAP
jgi:hypothetical protein